MRYAHIDDVEKSFAVPVVYAGIRNFDCLTDVQRAEYGVYPFILEPLNAGASGWGDAYFDEASQTIIKPSLPADPELALANAKASKYQERLEALINARNAGFMYNGKQVDSDQESRMLISGAVQLATLAVMAGTPEALAQFSASLGDGWRYSDGSIAATDAVGMIAIGQALAARIAYCDAVGQAHKMAIEACTTAAEINALDVTTGYEL